MEIIKRGYAYLVDFFTVDKETKELKKTGFNFPLKFIEPTINNDGTTSFSTGIKNEDLIDVIIDRIKFLNEKQPCRENLFALDKLNDAKTWLIKRSQRIEEERKSPLKQTESTPENLDKWRTEFVSQEGLAEFS